MAERAWLGEVSVDALQSAIRDIAADEAQGPEKEARGKNAIAVKQFLDAAQPTK